ncbi:putative protein N(5)-glutamine methyltransferase [Streptomyces verrucosisporus]|uniref:putative protein N(5)-glutamine methyltransferase n=1 Tax=Streptomyces verrucosisporus TaxID=1695161 RepID=UPI0019D266E5|nr:putative protein N(5)-glutamine methyltransferase [Streptomyces verrucosisporus]MBN3929720.1 putative protein N(5)-glutamine methyltransferase [Streptomyces verrucosisporus]
MSHPSPFSAPSALSAVAARLRAAGCVFAEDEARLMLSAARDPGELAAMAERRAGGLPLEHVLGWAEFRGLRIAVEPGVFVPRRRTEFLARRAAALAGRRRGAVVLDLCCGSGAVGAAVAAAVEGVELYAADVDPAAVRCARRNLAAAGGRVYEGDLYAPLPAALRGRVDVLLANAPYVPTGEMGLLPAEAREHEPPGALDGGPDGLGVQRRVIEEAPRWLAPDGCLLVETGGHQATRTAEAVTRAGLVPRTAVCEELYATVVVGAPAGAPAGDGDGPRQD